MSNHNRLTLPARVAQTAPQYQIPEWLAPHVAEVATWGPINGQDTTCWVGDCERSAHLHGLCRRHYFRAYEKWKNPRKPKSARNRGEDQ